MASRKREQADPKYGLGIILGYKYLDGFAENAAGNYSVKKDSLEIG